MTTANIKNNLIEKVKRMSSNDAKKIYGLILEHTENDSLFNSFNEIPEEHKLAIRKGVNDLKNGKNKAPISKYQSIYKHLKIIKN